MLPTAEDRDALGLVALPPAALAILEAEGAPPRLVAHLTLVHDVSRRLLKRMKKTWPWLLVDGVVDVDAVVFGAATHDVGKARIPSELSGPGKMHEAEGERLLLEHGTTPALARFARTHGADVAGLGLEDLLVVIADTVWKAKRSTTLDDAVVDAILGARSPALPRWEVFMALDEMLGAVADDADDRLAWQGRFGLLPPI